VHVKELNIVLHVSRLNNLLKFSISPGNFLAACLFSPVIF
jgi:hypothetical protein